MSRSYYDRDDDRYDERDDERSGRLSERGYRDSYSEPSRQFSRSSASRKYGDYGTSRRGDYDRQRDYSSRDYSTRDADRYNREDYSNRNYGTDYGTAEMYRGTVGRDTVGSYENDYDRGRYDYSEPSTRYSGSGQQGYSGGGYTPSRYNRSAGYNRGSDYDYQDREYGTRGRGGRGWWDRASDEVMSWLGDEEAERRRRKDEAREQNYRGRGPRGYRRSDERISEDINDRLTEHPRLDAADIDVSVSNSEVTLSGTVESRRAKRLAEDILEDVSGVSNVQNNLRISRQAYAATSASDTTSTTATTASDATGTTDTTTTLNERSRSASGS